MTIDRAKVVEFFRRFNFTQDLNKNLESSNLSSDETWYATELAGAHLNLFVNGFIGISENFDRYCLDESFRKTVVDHLIVETTPFLGTRKNSWYEKVLFDDDKREFNFLS